MAVLLAVEVAVQLVLVEDGLDITEVGETVLCTL